MSNCNRCNAPIGWSQVDGKNIPTNQDGSDHRNTCSGKSQGFQTSGSPKPAVSPEQVLQRCTLFLEAFKDLEPEKFDSLARIFISGMMNK